MSDFTFLHIADVHLGTVFKGLRLRDERVAREFAEATRGAFEHLIARAVAERMDFVLIAGDLYDGAWTDAREGLFFNRVAARLDRAGIPLFVIKGNHDASSVVLRSVPLPEGVHTFGDDGATTRRVPGLPVAIHGRSYGQRVVHEHPHVVYPGNVQGRSVRETGAKGAVRVRVEGRRVVACEPIVADRARWAVARVDIAGAGAVEDLPPLVEDAVRQAAGQAEDRLLALRVELVGTSPLVPAIAARLRALRDEVEAVCHQVSDRVWLEEVKLRAQEPLAPPLAADLADDLDLRALVDDARADPALRAALEDHLAKALGKLRAAGIEIGGDSALSLDELMGEAGAVAGARAFGAAAPDAEPGHGPQDGEA